MKTDVSLPDEVFHRATREAKRLGISRSELVASALRGYLQHRDDEEVRGSYDPAFGHAGDTGGDDPFRREAVR